jgi:Protein of unknown function (DUF3047)
VLTLARVAAGEEWTPLPAPGPPAWQPVRLPGVERATVYTPERENGRPVLRATADCSASGLLLRLPSPVDLSRTPRLRWRWRVERGLDVADETTRAGDDFAARIYVLFPPEHEPRSAWEWLRRALLRRLYAEEPPGHALDYVWASRAAPGTRWPNPYAPENTMIVLRSGGATAHGTWRVEDVDLAADHLRLLGVPAPPVEAVALMTDADQTCARAEAGYADFAFGGPGN